MKVTPQLNWEDKEHLILMKAKQRHGGNWHDFILDLARRYLEEENEN